MKRSLLPAAAVGFVLLENVTLALIQPLSVMTRSIEVVYATGNVRTTTIVVLALATALSLMPILVLRSKLVRAEDELGDIRFALWAKVNQFLASTAVIAAIFALASIALAFGYLDLDDRFGRVATGPFWAFQMNFWLVISLSLIWAFSDIRRRNEVKTAARSDAEHPFP